MLEYEGQGKTIEKAIENALFELKAPREDVDIKILEEGGLFKKAKVLVSISEDMREKYEIKKQQREKILIEEVVEEINEDVEEFDDNLKNIQKVDDVQNEENCEEVTCENSDSSSYDNQQNFEEVAISKTEVFDMGNQITCGKEFLEGFISTLGYPCEVRLSEEDEVKRFEVLGDKSSNLVGFRGECLNAIQYITSIIEGKSDRNKRVVLDIDNYREKREQTLVALAHRMARKVAKTNHQVKLEPMTANERRIIHTALQNDNLVTTVSKGTEPNRFLVILPKKEVSNN